MWNNAGNRHTLAAAAILLGMSSPLLADSDSETAIFKGEVTDRSSGDLLYTEHHEQTGACVKGGWQISDHQVRYKDPEGKLFARKELSYQHAQQRPSYTIEDLRFDEKMQVTNQDDRRLEIRWETMDGKVETFSPKVPSSGVIDAGFTALAGENWETLVEKEKSLSIEFLASTRGKFYDFEVEKTRKPSAMTGDYAFRIHSTGWVTRWFVDEIIVGYNEERQLTDYIGQTNIRRHDNPDEQYNGHIRYTYQQWPDC